jgi:hypothetical protein
MNFNQFMIWLLRSPLHGLFSGNIMVMHIRGVKSGKLYRVPVNYVTVEDECRKRLLVTSERQRTWWCNLRDRIKLDLTFKGKQTPATAQAFVGQTEVSTGLRAYFQASPRSARFFGIDLTPEGTVQVDDLNQLAEDRVVIWVELSEVGKSS